MYGFVLIWNQSKILKRCYFDFPQNTYNIIISYYYTLCVYYFNDVIGFKIYS